MISLAKKITAGFVATFALVFGMSLVPALSAPAVALESPQTTKLCNGVDATGGEGCGTATGETEFEALVKNILNILSWIIGIISVVMIIIGGFRYIISSGDSGQLQSAKNTILYAVVGLVIVLFAQLIVRFVVGTATGAGNGAVI